MTLLPQAQAINLMPKTNIPVMDAIDTKVLSGVSHFQNSPHVTANLHTLACRKYNNRPAIMHWQSPAHMVADKRESWTHDARWTSSTCYGHHFITPDNPGLYPDVPASTMIACYAKLKAMHKDHKKHTTCPLQCKRSSATSSLMWFLMIIFLNSKIQKKATTKAPSITSSSTSSTTLPSSQKPWSMTTKSSSTNLWIWISLSLFTSKRRAMSILYHQHKNPHQHQNNNTHMSNTCSINVHVQ